MLAVPSCWNPIPYMCSNYLQIAQRGRTFRVRYSPFYGRPCDPKRRDKSQEGDRFILGLLTQGHLIRSKPLLPPWRGNRTRERRGGLVPGGGQVETESRSQPARPWAAWEPAGSGSEPHAGRGRRRAHRRIPPLRGRRQWGRCARRPLPWLAGPRPPPLPKAAFNLNASNQRVLPRGARPQCRAPL